MARPQRVHYTWDDYIKLPDDGKRYEIIDGELFVTAAPATGHQYTSAEIYDVLRRWARESAGGLVFYAPVDVVLARDVIVQPDLIWFSDDRIEHVNALRVTGIPDLVVEILSPGTARRDRSKKSEVYARFGAREYWLVDPKDESVEIRTLRGHWFVTHVRGTGETELRSAMDPRLSVVPARLFRQFGPR